MYLAYIKIGFSEMKEYVQEHGIGNSKEPVVLQNFYAQFMAPNKIQ